MVQAASEPDTWTLTSTYGDCKPLLLNQGRRRKIISRGTGNTWAARGNLFQLQALADRCGVDRRSQRAPLRPSPQAAVMKFGPCSSLTSRAIARSTMPLSADSIRSEEH